MYLNPELETQQILINELDTLNEKLQKKKKEYIDKVEEHNQKVKEIHIALKD